MFPDSKDMLSGVRVLDLSRLLPGPAATWFLQGLGAQVDRIEGEHGDLTRHLPPYVDGVGAYFAALSQGKRSIQINLRSKGAALLIKRMLHNYDVLVEGFKPGTLETIGINPIELRVSHPQLIIARLSGYGQTGPYANRVGHDVNYLAMSGILSAQQIHDGHHVLPAAQLADLSGSMTAAMGICAALFHRSSSGQGRILDVSLTESAMAMWAPMIAGFLNQEQNPVPGGEMLSGGASVYGTYECLDGNFISLGAIEPKFQATLKSKVGELSRENLIKTFKSKPQQFWVDSLSEACVSPVLNVMDLVTHPHHRARNVLNGGLVRPPLGKNIGTPPVLGGDGRAILHECGFIDNDIQELISEGILLNA